MITFANKNHIKDNLKFEIIDVEALKIEKKFDVITSFFCLPWVKNKALAFNNMASLLKENGKLIAIFALFADSHISLLDKLIKEPRWERYFRNYPSPFDSLNDLNYEYYASSVGIQLDSLISKSIKHVFKTKSDLENFFTALVPHVNQISETYERKAFIDDIVTNYLKESVITDYSLTIDSIS